MNDVSSGIQGKREIPIFVGNGRNRRILLLLLGYDFRPWHNRATLIINNPCDNDPLYRPLHENFLRRARNHSCNQQHKAEI